MAATTALRGIRDVGEVRSGQRVLINGAAGGVGMFAVQIATALGAEVTGVCSAGNAEMVRSIGATQVIDYATQDFSDGSERYDVILDNIGNRPLSRLRRALTPKGILLLNGGGSPGKVFGAIGSLLKGNVVNAFVPERIRVLPTVLKRDDRSTVTQLIEAGKLRPVVRRTYPLAETAEGLRRVEAGHVPGKLVIALA